MANELNMRRSGITKTEKFLSIAFCFILFIPFANYYASFCLKEFGYETLTIIFYPLIYIFALISYFLVLRQSIKVLYFLLFFLFVLVFSVLNFPQNASYIFGDWLDLPYNPIYRVVFLGFPLLFIPFVIHDFDYLNRKFRFFSRITLLISDFAFVYLIVLDDADFEYLTFANYMLLPAVYCFVDSINRKNVPFFLVSLLSLFCAAFVGSRGALISVLVFFLIFCFFFYTNHNKRAFLIVLLLVSSVIVFLFYEEIIVGLIKLSESLNFESRSLENLLDSTLFESKGRDEISRELLSGIGKNILGYGIFGDRPITGGSYAHNIFLELWVHFGLIVGTLLIIIYLYITFSPMIFNKYKYDSDVFVLYFSLFSSTFVKLMFSDSYLVYPTFWALIAFSILLVWGKKHEKNN